MLGDLSLWKMQRISPLLLALTHTSPQPARRSHFVLLHQIIPIRFLTFLNLLPKSGKQVFTKNKKALCPVLTESTKCPYSSRSLECDLPLFSCFLSASSLWIFATFNASFSLIDGFTSFLISSTTAFFFSGCFNWQPSQQLFPSHIRFF